MKTTSFLYISFISMALMAIGCGKNSLQTPEPFPQETVSFEISASLTGEPETKMSYYECTDSEGAPYLSSVWTAGDGLSVTPDASDPWNVSTFSLAGGEGTRDGVFRCEDPFTGLSSTWTVFYPVSVRSEADYDAFGFDNQVQDGDDNLNHISALNLMKKTYAFDSAQEMPTEISFSGEGFEQSSCMKFVLENFPEEIVVKSLTFEAYRYVSWIWSSYEEAVVKETSFLQTMTFTNMTPSDHLTAYMAMSPDDKVFENVGYLKVTVTADDGTSFVTERKHSETVTLAQGRYNTMSLKKNWVTDTGVDGTWGAFQTPSASDISTPYCNFIIMGDGYVDSDYATGGKFMSDARTAYEALFLMEPFKSLKDYFGVYYVNVVSGQGIMTTGSYLNGAQNVNTNTSLEVLFKPDATTITGNNSRALHYAQKVEDLSLAQVNRSVIIVLANKDTHAGTCSIYYMLNAADYCQAHSVAYVALGNEGDRKTADFMACVIHEACGHGFGKLADEYTSYSYYSNLTNAQNNLLSMHAYGIYKNVHPYETGITSLDDTPWSGLAGIGPYMPEKIGIYEGAYAVGSGFCRSTEDSVMRSSDLATGYFNAVSRKMIYHRAMRLSGWTQEEAENSFLAWDAAHLPAGGAYLTVKGGGLEFTKESALKPLAPPVLIPIE